MANKPRYTTFSEAGITIPAGAGAQVHTICPKCTPIRKPEHQRERDLSVNVGEGTWFCHHCGWTGGLSDPIYRSHSGAGATPISQRPKIHQSPRTIPMTTDQHMQDRITDYCADRGIGTSTADHFRIWVDYSYPPQSDKPHLTIHFPYFVGTKHVNTKHRTIEGNRYYWQEAGCEQTFFNLQNIDPTQPIIITEGELDAMSVHEAGLTNVLSVPGGAPEKEGQNLTVKMAFMESAADLLAQAPEVILAVDADGPGQVLQAELARRVGALKCRRVKWPTECKDANDVLVAYGPSGLKQVIDNAPIYPVAGLYTGEDLLDDLDYAYDHGWDTGSKCGLGNLDAICRLATGYISIWTGHSGSGKSTVLDNVLVGLAATSDWPIALYSPEQMPLARHQQNLITIAGRKPLKPGTADRMSKDEMFAVNRWLSDYFSYVNPKDSRDLDSILEHIRQEVVRRGIKMFVLDPWNCIADEKPAHMNGTDWINKALFKIKMFAQETGTHGAMVAHPTKLRDNSRDKGGPEPRPTLTDIAGSINFRNQADYGVVVHRDQGNRASGDIVEVSIAKIRMQETGSPGERCFFEYDRPTARIRPYSGPIPEGF